jgi:hypothetical protein
LSVKSCIEGATDLLLTEEFGFPEDEANRRMFSPEYSDALDLKGTEEEDQDVIAATYSEQGSVSTTKDPVAEAVEKAVVSKVYDSSSSSSSLTTESEEAGDEVRVSTYVHNGGTSSSSPYVTVSDVLCKACNKFLYRPVVVNCGHGES